MECGEARVLLEAYLDQVLPSEQASALEAHFRECDGCRQDLLLLQSLDDALHDPQLQSMVLNEPAPLPADFTAQVMSRVETERPTGWNLVLPWLRRRWSRRQYASVAYAMGATAVVFSAGNLLYLWNQATDRLTVWGAQAQAYGVAASVNVTGVGFQFAALWHGLMALLHLA